MQADCWSLLAQHRVLVHSSSALVNVSRVSTRTTTVLMPCVPFRLLSCSAALFALHGVRTYLNVPLPCVAEAWGPPVDCSLLLTHAYVLCSFV